jgi:hypothetical protein
MPTQNTTIDEGFEGCGSVRISYSPTATPRTPLLEDDEGRYFLVDRTEPTQALKIVLQYTPASDPYDSYTATYRITGSFEEVQYDFSVSPRREEVVTVPVDETLFNGSYGKGPYHRRIPRAVNESYPDGGYRNSILLGFFCAPVVVDDYDENGNPIQYTIEPPGFEIESSSQSLQFYATGDNGDIFLSASSSTQVLSLTTSDGRPIDIDTAAVSDGWVIVVYEVYEWGDSELSRVQFDSNPQPVTVECLESVCDDDCIPTYDSENNLLCICRDAEVNETDGYEYQPYEHNQTRPRYNEYTP